MCQYEDDQVMRAFLALEIPNEVKLQLQTELNRVRGSLPRARWVRPHGLHLTLKFLGELEWGRLRALSAAIAPSLQPLAPVAVTLAGSGFFPSRSRPRVAWVGGEAVGIQPVVEAVESASVKQGLARERRRWSLHLTLARIRQPWPRSAVAAFQEWGERLSLVPFTAREVVLFRSVLEPAGAVYTGLERMPLG